MSKLLTLPRRQRLPRRQAMGAGHRSRLTLAWCCLALVQLLGRDLCQAAPQIYTRDVTFATAGQSLWGAGPEYTATYSDFWGISWNDSSSGGGTRDITIPGGCTPPLIVEGIEIIPEICVDDTHLGTFGATGSASTSGTIGLRAHASVGGGAVSLSYPIDVTIRYPENGVLRPGDSFTIETSFVPDVTGTSLTTTSPRARAMLDAVLNASFSSSAKLQAGAAGTIFDGSLFDFSIGPHDTRIIDTDSPIFRGLVGAGGNFALFTATNGVLSGTFRELEIATQGGLLVNTNKLASQDSATFFTAKLDYTNAIVTAAGLPPFNRRISLPLGDAASFAAELQVLDFYELIDFAVSQTFIFDPTPRVRLQLSTGQTVEMNVGESRTLTFPLVSPGAATNELTLTPTWSLPNQFTNRTNLVISPSINFTPLNVSYSGSAAGQSLGSFSLKPVDTYSVDHGDSVISLFNQNFSLGGLSPTTTPAFTLTGFVYPRPSLDSVAPFIIQQGSGARTLDVHGNALVDAHTNSVHTIPGSTVYWNHQPRTTRKITPRMMEADITAGDVSTEGTFKVKIVNPSPGGGSSEEKDVIVDGTPPVTNPSLSGPQNTDHHGWYTGPVTVSLSTVDNLAGVMQVLYWVDGGGSQRHTPSTLTIGTTPFLTPPFTVQGDGRHQVQYWGGDNAGNNETQKSVPVLIDGTPPGITGSRHPLGNEHGWNNGPVTVHFDASDATSGIASVTPDTVLDKEAANQSVTGTAVDHAGNSASATVDGIHIDLTKPTVTYTGNAGHYTVDQMVNITCTVSDNLSGVLSHDGRNIVGPAYSFALGSNSFSAKATDKAGNIGQGSTSFTVEVTYSSLCALVEQLVPHHGIANSLCAKLRAAENAAERGQQHTKANILDAFMHEVDAQTGKHIPTGAAPILIQMARAL